MDIPDVNYLNEKHAHQITIEHAIKRINEIENDNTSLLKEGREIIERLENEKEIEKNAHLKTIENASKQLGLLSKEKEHLEILLDKYDKNARQYLKRKHNGLDEEDDRMRKKRNRYVWDFKYDSHIKVPRFK